MKNANGGVLLLVKLQAGALPNRTASQNSLQAQTFPQDLNTFSIVQEHSVDLMQIYKQCQYVN